MPATPAVYLRLTTQDGCLLDSLLYEPAEVATETGFVLIHGTGSNAFAPGILETLAFDLSRTARVLRLNTRGHDGICSIPLKDGRSKPGGATHEVISECPLDITSAVEALRSRGCRDVVLIGHSMGGVKAIYAQAQAPHPQVRSLVCLSPPRFCHRHWMQHPQADAFRATFAEAQAAVDSHDPERLLRSRQPVPFLATARGFLEKYGPEDRYDIIRLLPKVRVPVRIAIGAETLKSSPAFDTLPANVDQLQNSGAPVTLTILPGVNMSYSGAADEVCRLIREPQGGLRASSAHA